MKEKNKVFESDLNQLFIFFFFRRAVFRCIIAVHKEPMQEDLLVYFSHGRFNQNESDL